MRVDVLLVPPLYPAGTRLNNQFALPCQPQHCLVFLEWFQLSKLWKTYLGTLSGLGLKCLRGCFDSFWSRCTAKEQQMRVVIKTYCILYCISCFCVVIIKKMSNLKHAGLRSIAARACPDTFDQGTDDHWSNSQWDCKLIGGGVVPGLFLIWQETAQVNYDMGFRLCLCSFNVRLNLTAALQLCTYESAFLKSRTSLVSYPLAFLMEISGAASLMLWLNRLVLSRLDQEACGVQMKLRI